MTVIQQHGPYRFGSGRGLSGLQMEQLSEGFQIPAQSVPGQLGGRTPIRSIQLSRIGSVVIKTYFRGGLAGRVIRRTYLGIGPCRGHAEFEMLRRVRALGVKAPKPVAFAVQGRLFQHTWLITRQLADTRTLADMSAEDPETARQVMAQVGSQVRRLAENRILHVDLHPGNILVDTRPQVYIIDFDKAVTTAYHSSKLRQRYIRRWRRAVIKHELPLFLHEEFQTALG